MAETKSLLSTSASGLDPEIKSLLKVIQSKPAGGGGGGGESKQGSLLKKKRKTSSWGSFYFELNPSAATLTYKSSQGGRTVGVIKVAFLSFQQITQEDELALKQHKKGGDVCKYRVSLFSHSRHYVLSAESDVEMQAWIDAIDSVLKSKYSESELSAKRDAAAKLAPLIEEQVDLQHERYKYLNTVLAQSGFLSVDGPTKLKEGYLKIRQDDAEGSWKQFYFVLHKRYLNYYRLDDKSIPHGIIALKFMVSIEPIEGKKQNNRRFIVATPLRTYLFRAKHEVAMLDWINSIRQAKGKETKGATAELLPVEADGGDAPAIDGRKLLVYSINGRTKSYTLSGKCTTIGRASNNDLKINDSKVSRNHARIETVPGKAPMFFDLGSSRGSKVNNDKVTKKALRVGDTMKIGSTVLTLEVRH